MIKFAAQVSLGTPVGNVVTNPGFETAGSGAPVETFDDWSDGGTGGSLVDETTIVHGGGHSCKCVSAGAGQDAWVQRGIPDPQPGHRYVIRVWCYGTGGDSGYILVYDETNDDILIYDVCGAFGPNWVEFSRVFTVPATCTDLWFRLSAGDSVGAYYDDVVVMDLDDVSWAELEDVLNDPPIEWEYGMADAGPLDLLASTGMLHLALDNGLTNGAGLPGLYSPEHANHLAGFNEGAQVKLELALQRE